jgi:hypothetical protein
MADSSPSPIPSPAAPAADAPPRSIVITTGEFYWLTLGMWLGGIFILTLMPVLLIPRLGMALGVAGSYLLFFVAWQPIQIITQRTFGVGSAVLRMVLFVGAAATVAFYIRLALPRIAGG